MIPRFRIEKVQIIFFFRFSFSIFRTSKKIKFYFRTPCTILVDRLDATIVADRLDYLTLIDGLDSLILVDCLDSFSRLFCTALRSLGGGPF